MVYLFDINILIAVADPDHEHHKRAMEFFLAHHTEGWATCPTTENGFIRIISQPSYPKCLPSSDSACTVLKDLCGKDGHRFWSDEITLRTSLVLPRSKHLTDHYLLCLAVQKGGKLATMDERIDASIVTGGPGAYLVI